MMRRALVHLAGCALAVLLGGCAHAPSVEPAGRYEDPSFGLLPEYRHSPASPLQTQPTWQSITEQQEARRPRELSAQDPVTASGEQHYSWYAESPMAARPRHGVFFLSGFVAGFMARLAYGAYQGSRGEGVSGSDVASSVTIGALTGLITWSFSFRLSPEQMTKTTPEQELPKLEDSSVFRDWAPKRP